MTHKKVGVLGGGQLGQMLMLAGYPLGIQTVAFDKTDEVCASAVGTVVAGELSDTEKLHQWASEVDVITYEWENYPAELVSDLSEIRPVVPGPNAIAAAQDRLREKRLFVELEIPITAFRAAENETEFRAAVRDLELPLYVKSTTGGYDSLGQVVYRSESDLAAVLELIAGGTVIVEQGVNFEIEASIIGVRGRDGTIATYPLIENENRKSILHTSRVPARVPDSVRNEATHYITTLMNHLQYVGVLALELFVTDGRVVANEMAPRVHNSGHWTIEGADTSQFENHLRAVCGLPLGSTKMRGPAAMINLIGREPRIRDILEIEGAHLHIYGKTERSGRKLGHVTVTAATDDELHKRIAQVEAVVTNDL